MMRLSQRVQKRLHYLLSTEFGLSALFAGVSIVLIAFILSSRYLNFDNPIQADVSLKDLSAVTTLRVLDKEGTERARYEARQLSPLIYKHDGVMDKYVMDHLANLLGKLQRLREHRSAYAGSDMAELKAAMNPGDDPQSHQLQTLLTTPHWGVIQQTVLNTTQQLLNQGVTSEDFRLKRESRIRQALAPTTKLTDAETEAIVTLISSVLEPDNFIDAKSTDEARNLSASHVKPLWAVFSKGELIVKKGDRLTQLQHDALIQQGSLVGHNRGLICLGVFILTACLLFIVWGYLYRFEHSTYFKPAYAGLLAAAMVATVAGISLGIDVWGSSFPVNLYPVAILPLMICLFTHPRIAILVTTMTLILCGLVFKFPLEALSVMIISSMTGVFVLSRKAVTTDRNDLIFAGLAVGITSAAVILALRFIYGPSQETGDMSFFNQVIIAILSGVFSGVFTSGVLPIIENWFKLVTPYTLLELANYNRPILRRMQLEAPGTFHHSVMVATLSEAAAEAVGANPILTRTGALYHDIGKIKRPLFFIENQAYFGVENPHDKLTPRLSKMVITAHPRDGVEMGKHLGLPAAILRFMPEHHGTLTAGYFYSQAVREEGEENVNKAQFRYPGPKPQTRESAIVMMADACESAVRAMKSPTVAQVEERVDKIIKQRIDDGQFNECAITMQDIQIARDTFIRILRGIQHNRIEYQENVLKELGRKHAGDLRELVQAIQPITEGDMLIPTNGLPQNGQANGHALDPVCEPKSAAEAAPLLATPGEISSISSLPKEVDDEGCGCC